MTDTIELTLRGKPYKFSQEFLESIFSVGTIFEIAGRRAKIIDDKNGQLVIDNDDSELKRKQCDEFMAANNWVNNKEYGPHRIKESAE